MSLLQNPDSTPTHEERLARRVDQIKKAPARLVENMYAEWERSFNDLWNNDNFTVSEKLSAIGTSGEELFDLNTAFTTFMLTQLTGKRDDLVQRMAEKLAQIPQYEVSAEGVVSLVPQLSGE